MDSEFPDPDEEYEMRYADEIELMKELDFDEDKAPIMPKGHDVKVKKSLKFDDVGSHGSRSGSSLGGSTPIPDENARKRQQDDVFGSLSDDEELCGGNPPKKSRNDATSSVETGRLFPEKWKQTAVDKAATIHIPPPKRYVYRLIPNVPHQGITTHSGEKIYVKMISEDSLKQREIELGSKNHGNLLKVSVQVLKQQIQEEMRRKSAQISDEQFERRLRELESVELKQGGTLTTDDSERDVQENLSASDLWVEKYRPKSYLDLLSEENVNRTLLHWLKLWDKAVFNREVKIKVAKSELEKPKWAASTEGSKSFDANKNKKFGDKFVPKNKNTDGDLKEELDSTGRPLQKIVLISGPPGLGKTTLAHVVARHAGYNPVEMNASDDRNVEAFKLQLEAATQMRSVMSRDPRPNCLIIDEIDGAPAPSVAFLVNAVQSQETDSKDKAAAGKKKKKKGPNMVSRPIICICNELYTPSLRPLRQAALVLQFPPTNPTRLAQRLMGISKAHSMQADMSALLALCEKADYDIRSCLATLYFLQTLKRPLRYSDVININIGHKDNHKSLFQVWQEIFHIPRPKRRQYIEVQDREGLLPMAPDVDRPLEPEAGQTASLSARFMNILHAVHSCGEYDRLMQGIFENYPTIKFKDSYMSAVCTGLDLMCYYDLLNHEIQLTQNYSTFGYLPYTFVGIHFQLAAVLTQKIKYPTAHTEFKTKLNQHQSIVTSMVQDLKACVRVTNSPAIIIRDIIPYILPIITPSLRPVSAQLYSATEKEQIQRVIDVMISYNLTYRQEKTIEGTYRYCLEPDVEQLAYFGSGGVNNRRMLTYSVKQMLAREIELEKMRHYENSLGPIIAPVVKEVAKQQQPTIQPPPSNTRPLTLKPKEVTETYKSATDFFGRPIRTPTKKKNADGSVETGQNDVWYHFKEGYSNAVRRNVKMSDFV